MGDKKTVFVGLSGGVDSSVAALRLKQQGHDVVGVFIKVWQPEFLDCDWESERLDAMRVAAKLKIPFHTCNAEAAYKREVADHMIREYKAGRTPNPDVMCNQYVKFGVFLKYALENGADTIATGHYARIRRMNDGPGITNHALLKGIDINKDQSYFLWKLGQEQLKVTHFPIGDSTKKEIRKEAASHGLLTAQKKDSQGICFLGEVDMRAFLEHYIAPKQGDVLDMSDNRIGYHDGATFLTIGQRHGFVITDKKAHKDPQYVQKKDLAKNIVWVSTQKPMTSDTHLSLSSVNWIRSSRIKGETVEAVTRYREKPRTTRILSSSDRDLELSFDSPLHAPTVGQSCVLYDGDECLGGGIIEHIDH